MAPPTPTVALVAAMPNELAPLVRSLRLRRTDEHAAGATLHRGRAGDVDVVALRTGIGPERAAEVADALLAAEDVDRLVVSGIAGGIAPHSDVGDLVVPEVVVDGTTGERFTATAVGPTAPHGVLRTGGTDSYLTSAAELASYSEDGVAAVDMETASIVRACARRDVPWIAFRAISDMAGDPSVGPIVMELVDAEGRPRPLPALRFLATHPQRIPRMVRLGRDASRAARTAAEGAVATLA